MLLEPREATWGGGASPKAPEGGRQQQAGISDSAASCTSLRTHLRVPSLCPPLSGSCPTFSTLHLIRVQSAVQLSFTLEASVTCMQSYLTLIITVSYLQRTSHKTVSWFLKRDLAGKKGLERSIPSHERQGPISKIALFQYKCAQPLSRKWWHCFSVLIDRKKWNTGSASSEWWAVASC